MCVQPEPSVLCCVIVEVVTCPPVCSGKGTAAITLFCIKPIQHLKSALKPYCLNPASLAYTYQVGKKKKSGKKFFVFIF